MNDNDLKIKTEAIRDQAWARISEYFEDIERILTERTIIENLSDDEKIVNLVLNIVLGELLMRKADILDLECELFDKDEEV